MAPLLLNLHQQDWKPITHEDSDVTMVANKITFADRVARIGEGHANTENAFSEGRGEERRTHKVRRSDEKESAAGGFFRKPIE
jgi:hypothetical protein